MTHKLRCRCVVCEGNSRPVVGVFARIRANPKAMKLVPQHGLPPLADLLGEFEKKYEGMWRELTGFIPPPPKAGDFRRLSEALPPAVEPGSRIGCAQ